MAGNNRILNVGLIGCGEIAQVVHIPTLGFLSDRFQITYLCDVSADALNHCHGKIAGKPPLTTTDPAELCASPTVDVVFVINSDEYHADHAILALQNDKHVFIEKPAALNRQDLQRMKDAEVTSKGKAMVGYMRRYATAFERAVEEVGGLDNILYARVRDIIGPNSAFVSQSGTFPKRFSDFRPEDSADMAKRGDEHVRIGLKENGVEVSDVNRRFWRYLGGLGSHDLSAMREILGMPTGIHGASATLPFWNVLFKYPNFTVSYESGIDDVPRFDAHIEVYSKRKTVKVQFDTPYVKGLPIFLHIVENDSGIYKETTQRLTYEDPYTLEMRRLYEWATAGTPVKTTLEDAEKDLDVFGMILKAL
ncbi:hypothetical protein B0J11DRAFT_183741 [Dendryphion nanum]|uniref:Gfo/Idh/MocA-like oxidoreductase N-terminal domain-containing protein n=1 Tax=Dendryphion nanum TaxID=256645 RepID=A0A9P9D5F3_9PLEO|nr:hypothetical protein B0J11DRAFT_183741 [Dendryphion nanum]